MGTTLNKAASALLNNSLEHHVRERRGFERRARKAYTGAGDLGKAAQLLADAHAEAAAVYERALRTLRGEETPATTTPAELEQLREELERARARAGGGG